MSSGASGQSQRARFASVSTTDTASLDWDDNSNSPTERGSSVDPTYVDHRDHGDGPEDTPRPETPPLFQYPVGTTQHTPARIKLPEEKRDLSETLRSNIIQAAGGSDCFVTGEPFTNSNHVGMHFIGFATKGLVLRRHQSFAGAIINVDGRWNIAIAENRFHTNADAGRWALIPVVSRENPVLHPELWELRQNCDLAPGERTPYTDLFPQKVFPDSWCFKLVNLNYNGPVPLFVYTKQPDGSFSVESYPDSATADIFGTTHINPTNMICHAGKQVHKYSRVTDIPTFARLSPGDRKLIEDTKFLTQRIFSKDWVPEVAPATIPIGPALSTPVRAPRTRSQAKVILERPPSNTLSSVNEDDDVQSEPESPVDDSPAKRAKKVLERRRTSSMSKAATPPVSPPPGPRRSARIAPSAAEKQATETAMKKGKGKAVEPKTAVKAKTAGKARPATDAPETSKKNKRTEDEDEDEGDVERGVARPKKRGRAGH